MAIALVFGSLVGAGFAFWDDLETVAENPRLNPPSFPGLAEHWKRPHMDLYVPVTYTYWAAVAKLAWTATPDDAGHHLNPGVFHLANVLVHLATSLLVYAVVRRLGAGVWPAVFGALVFAVHPVQVEPVGWVSGGKDLLGGLFAATAIWLYLRGTPQTYAAALAAYALGMLAKPGVITLPLAIAAIDLLVRGRSWRQTAWSLWPWLVLAVPVAVMTKRIQPTPSTFDTPLWARPLVATDALAFYAAKLLWPSALTIDYGRAPDVVLRTGALYYTWPAPVAIAAVAVALRKRAPWLAGGLTVAVAMLLPVLGLVKFDFQRFSTVADHYLYTAMLGVAIIVAFTVHRLRGPAIYVVAGIVIAILGVRAGVQALVWENTLTLYEHGVAVNPTGMGPNNGLGNIAFTAGRYEEAIAWYSATLRDHPHDAVTNGSLANALMQLGRYREAADAYRYAVKGPPYAFVFTNYAVALLKSDRPAEAEAVAEEALDRWPDDPKLHQVLAMAFEARGNRTDAAEEYQRVLRLDPSRRDAKAGLERTGTTRPAR